MTFSIERLYKEFGQYDKVIVIEFIKDSESYHKYGQWLTGVFEYSPKERNALDQTIKNTPLPFTVAYQRFEGLLDLNDSQKQDLNKNGFNIQNILKIHDYSSKEKEYGKSGKRSLPPPIEVKFDSSDLTIKHLENIKLNLYGSILDKGDQLTPFEIIENNSIIADRHLDKIPKEHLSTFIDSETKKIKSELRYQILLRRLEDNSISENELKELEKLTQIESERRSDILMKELNKSTEQKKELEKHNPGIIKRLIAISIHFKPKRYNYGKVPIWIDYERFIHIYIRHVFETQIGERFKKKSRFNYDFEEVDYVMKIILGRLNKEIQQFFKENPSRDFKRHGEMSVYFKGDYYVIHIESTGRVMTFYKKGEKSN